MQLQLKFYILLTLLSLGHAQLRLAQPALIKWAELIEHIPTAVSHQSSTVVHSSVPQRTALLAPPAVRSFVLSPYLSPAAAYVHAHAAAAHAGWSYLYAAPSHASTYRTLYGK